MPGNMWSPPGKARKTRGNARGIYEEMDDGTHGVMNKQRQPTDNAAKTPRGKPCALRNRTHAHLAGCTGITREIYR